MIIPRWHVRAEGRKLVFDRPKVFGAYVQGLVEKGDLELSVRPWRKAKSLQQLRYVHGCIFVLCSQSSGYTQTEVKGLLKKEYLTEYVVSKKTGQEIPIVKSLEDLTMPEMSQFIDDCIIHAATEWSCVIPDAEEVKV